MNINMSFFRRIYLSVIRKPWMSVSMVLCAFLLGNFINASYSIYRSCIQIEKDIKQRLDTFVVIKDNHWFLDYDKETNHLTHFNSIINKINDNPMILEYSFPLVINNNNFRHYLENDNVVSYFSYGSPVDLTGIDNKNDFYFKNNFQLIEGEMISSSDFEQGSNVMLISSDYSYKDGSKIEIGDEISIFFDIVANEMTNTTSEEEIIERVEYRFKVIGKYVNNFKNTKLWEYPVKGFIVPNQTLMKIREESNINYERTLGKDFYAMMMYRNIVFKVNSIDEIDAFKEEFLNISNSDSAYQILTSIDGYNEIKGPLVNLKFISLTILCVSICASVLLLLLVQHLFIKNCENEIGILLAIGESFKKVKKQFSTIVLILGMIGICLSLFTGNILADIVSKEILRNQLKNSEQVLIDDSVSKEYILYQYEVDLDKNYLFMMLGVGSTILIGSTMISINQIKKEMIKKLL